ncbi:MAG: RHS repeat domain-containing protein [Phycisphaerales bacterium]
MGNRRGYAGYEFDPTFVGNKRSLYHVRHRVYDAGVGRWTRRDPLGYIDGMGLYEYVRTSPLRHTDDSGLRCGIDFGSYNLLNGGGQPSPPRCMPGYPGGSDPPRTREPPPSCPPRIPDTNPAEDNPSPNDGTPSIPGLNIIGCSRRTIGQIQNFAPALARWDEVKKLCPECPMPTIVCTKNSAPDYCPNDNVYGRTTCPADGNCATYIWLCINGIGETLAPDAGGTLIHELEHVLHCCRNIRGTKCIDRICRELPAYERDPFESGCQGGAPQCCETICHSAAEGCGDYDSCVRTCTQSAAERCNPDGSVRPRQ